MGLLGQDFNFGGFAGGGAASSYPVGSPKGHWKADAIEGLTNGQDVTTWVDSTGNGYNVTEATNKPIYTTPYQNGLPGVTFASPSVLNIADVAPQFSNSSCTIHIIYHPTAATGLLTVFAAIDIVSESGTHNDLEVNQSMTYTPDRSPTIYFGDGTSRDSDYVELNWPGIQCITIIRNGLGTDVKIYHNATLKALVGNGNTDFEYKNDVLDGFRFASRAAGGGGSNQFIGTICECIYYTTALSDADRASNVSALMTKWGLT